MKKALYAILAAIFVLMFATVANANPAPGSIGSNAVVQNAGTGDATVIVTYYNQAGSSVALDENQTIAEGAVREFKAADANLPTAFAGSAVVSSDQPLAAVVSLRATGVTASTDGLTQAAYNATVNAARTLYYPTVWGFDNINTIMSVQNTESTATTITATFFDRAGNNLGTSDFNLAGNGSVTINMDNTSDLPTGFPTTFTDGSVTITSSATNIAGAAHNAWENRAAAYQALTQQSQDTILYAPSHFRAENGSGGFNLFSAINIQNTSTTTAAPVTIEYFSRSDGSLTTTLNCTIPASSAVGLNTNNGGSGCTGIDASTFTNGLGNWDGSVKITSTDGIPLLGTGITNWGSGYAGMYALANANEAASKVFVPAQYRRSANGWAQWSAINVQNIGGSSIAAADLTVSYVDTAGNTVATFSGASLPSALSGGLADGAAFGMNTRNGGDLTADDFTGLTDNFIGGIVIEGPSGSGIVVVSNIVYSNRASTYNGVPASE